MCTARRYGTCSGQRRSRTSGKSPGRRTYGRSLVRSWFGTSGRSPVQRRFGKSPVRSWSGPSGRARCLAENGRPGCVAATGSGRPRLAPARAVCPDRNRPAYRIASSSFPAYRQQELISLGNTLDPPDTCTGCRTFDRFRSLCRTCRTSGRSFLGRCRRSAARRMCRRSLRRCALRSPCSTCSTSVRKSAAGSWSRMCCKSLRRSAVGSWSRMSGTYSPDPSGKARYPDESGRPRCVAATESGSRCPAPARAGCRGRNRSVCRIASSTSLANGAAGPAKCRRMGMIWRHRHVGVTRSSPLAAPVVRATLQNAGEPPTNLLANFVDVVDRGDDRNSPWNQSCRL